MTLLQSRPHIEHDTTGHRSDFQICFRSQKKHYYLCRQVDEIAIDATDAVIAR